MLEEIWRKLTYELTLLSVVATFSLSVCSLLIADASIGLTLERYGLILIAVRVCELALGMMWLFFSARMIVEIYGLRKKHFRIFGSHRSEDLKEQRRSATAELVRETVAFYRVNYLKVMIVLGLAVGVGFLIVGTATYLMLQGLISFWVAVFRWALSSLMLLIVSAFYVYVHRSWRKKLLRVKDAEKKLSEMLGWPIEA